jgi:tRNA threonylcarbamoyladenosine modification (KEOPS) complex  Pcc1 subunit
MPLLRQQDAVQAKGHSHEDKSKMSLSADIIIDEDTERLYKCLLPEAKKIKRSEMGLKKEKDRLVINVRASDATALRASVNSILKLIVVYEKMKDIK